MNCKICQSNANKIFTKKVLNKYQVSYYKCHECGFLFLNDIFWLEEAYSSAITMLDIGLLSRNYFFSELLTKILSRISNETDIFLDYAGGYGILVRLMRDKGYDFYRYDKYCQNIFSKCFDENWIETDKKYKVITAFEFLEHIENPIAEIETIFKRTGTFIFSTLLIPESFGNKDLSDWWYLTSETGQHISFYSFKTLQYISKITNKILISNGSDFHILSDDKRIRDLNLNRISDESLIIRLAKKIDKKIFPSRYQLGNRKSLQMKDYNSLLDEPLS